MRRGQSPPRRRTDRPGLTNDEIEEMRIAFNLFDTEGNGVLDLKELRTIMKALEFDVRFPSVFRLISDMEKSRPGAVDFEDFLDDLTANLSDRESREGLHKIFCLFDDDRTSTISFKNLKRVAEELGETMTDEELHEMIERADSNGDGEISFEDFYTIMTKKSFP